MSQTGSAGLSQTEQALRRAAEEVAAARADVTKLSADLSGQIQGMGARWGGQGASAFHTLHTAWQEKQSKIVGALDQFAESLVLTDKDNVSTDQSQADSAANLTSRLG